MSHSLGATSAPSVAPSSPPPSLIAPSDWIGTKLGWAAGVGQGQLVITLVPDAEMLAAKRAEALSQYRDIAAQLSSPGVLRVAVVSSINSVSAPVPVASAEVGLVAYVEATIAHLDAGKPRPAPVAIVADIAEPAGALPPIAIAVALVLAHFGETEAANRFALPHAERVDSAVGPDFGLGFAAFADRFHRAFPALRLALDGRRVATDVLWACGRQLAKPTIAGAPTYFAAAPLFDALQSGQTAVPNFGDWSQKSDWPTQPHTFTGADADRLLLGCFEEIDRVLAEPIASAVKQASSENFEALVNIRAAVARAYTDRQFSWLFKEQVATSAADPALAGAQAVYRDLVGVTLSDAYAIDAIVAIPGTWTELPAASAGPELSLLGFVRPTDGSPLAAGSSGRLYLHRNGATTGTLYYAFRPSGLTTDTSVSVPLEFVVTHVGVGDLTGGGTRWLALIDWETIRIGPETGVVLPVVNRFSPEPPTLLAQRAELSGGSSEVIFTDLLQWEYGAEVAVRPVAHDATTIVVHANVAPKPMAAIVRGRSLEPLAAALFRFHAGFAQIIPMLPNLARDASSAANITAAIVDLFAAVQRPNCWVAPHRAAELVRSESDEVARLTVSLAQDRTTSGRWIMTVLRSGARAESDLSVTPCTSRGDPQPNVQQVGEKPLAISYDPVDPNDSVLIRVVAKRLPLLGVQTAQADARLARNGELIAGLTTLPRYRRTTDTLSFVGPVAPLRVAPGAGYDVATVGAAPSTGRLVDWVSLLFRTVFGGAAPIRVEVKVQYAFRLDAGSAGGMSLMSSLPVLMTGTTPIGTDDADSTTSDDFGATVAAAMTHWFQGYRPSTSEARFDFDLAVHATESLGGQRLLETSFRLALDKIKDL